jgi:hypothetical protein
VLGSAPLPPGGSAAVDLRSAQDAGHPNPSVPLARTPTRDVDDGEPRPDFPNSAEPDTRRDLVSAAVGQSVVHFAVYKHLSAPPNAARTLDLRPDAPSQGRSTDKDTEGDDRRGDQPPGSHRWPPQRLKAGGGLPNAHHPIVLRPLSSRKVPTPAISTRRRHGRHVHDGIDGPDTAARPSVVRHSTRETANASGRRRTGGRRRFRRSRAGFRLVEPQGWQDLNPRPTVLETVHL